ncbi:MAG: class I SAM-dependent methyltransferase [Elusimicrobiota bacterium]
MPLPWLKRALDEESGARSRIRRQVEGIDKLLGLKFRARVLDLGCGSGCQTLELARRSYRVVGMDSSAKGLVSAREMARAENLTAHFAVNDPRRIPYREEFSAVLNLRNPIGCFASEREDLDCLRGAQRSLRPGGKLLLDLLNREWVVRRLEAGPRGARESRFDLRTGRLDCSAFTPRGGSAPCREGLRVYSLSEIIRLLDEAGFVFRGVWGGYDGEPYWVDSLRMIVNAEKTEARRGPRRRVDDGLPRAVRIKGRGR